MTKYIGVPRRVLFNSRISSALCFRAYFSPLPRGRLLFERASNASNAARPWHSHVPSREKSVTQRMKATRRETKGEQEQERCTRRPERARKTTYTYICSSLSHTEALCTCVRARANYRRLSVPFEANPIIRNETASFHSLVQTHLFILRGWTGVRTARESERGVKDTVNGRRQELKGWRDSEVGLRDV